MAERKGNNTNSKVRAATNNLLVMVNLRQMTITKGLWQKINKINGIVVLIENLVQ